MRKGKKAFDLLFEETESVDTPEKSMSMTSGALRARKSPDSVDDQIDALILRYEASSIREENKLVDGLLETSLKRKNLKFLLEQEEGEIEDPADAAEVTPEDDAGDEPAPEPDPTGSEKMNVDEPGDPQIPDLDMDAFAARTVRLIINHRNLLKMEEAITNRVKNFLDENYGDKYVQHYLDTLENQFGISMEEFENKSVVTDDNFAVGAYAGGTGGLGGGGG